ASAAWRARDGGAHGLDGLRDGHITTTWTVGLNEAGAAFRATARGLRSHLKAVTTFTDSASAPVLLGTAGDASAASTSISISLATLAQTAAVGDTVIITFAVDPSSGTVSASDTKGNTYTNDVDVADGSSTNGVRTVILSSRITTALTTTDSITINFPSAVAKAAAAYKVAGLVTSGTILDKTHTGTGSGDSPDS